MKTTRDGMVKGGIMPRASKLFLLSFLLLAFLSGAQAACNDCMVQVIPVQNNLCQGEAAIFDIRVINAFPQSKAVTFTADSDIAMDSDLSSTIVLDPYETRTFRAVFYPKEVRYGEHRLTITATGLGVKDSDDVVFHINDCYDIEVCGDTDMEVCEGSVGQLAFTVKNVGSREDTYSISVSGVPPALEATPSEEQVTIPAGASKDLYLNVKGVTGRYDDYELQVNIVSLRNSVVKKVGVSLVDCHQQTLEAPPRFETCADSGLTYMAKLTNSGRLASDYTLTVGGTCQASISPESVRLAPGESREILVSLAPEVGECDVSLSARDDYGTSSASTHVSVADCYGMDLELIPPIEERCRGEPAKFVARVTNKGYLRDTYTLDFTGIETDLDGRSVILDPGASADFPFNLSGTWCVADDISFRVSAAGHASDSEDGLLRFLSDEGRCSGIMIIPSTMPMQIDCDGGSYTFIVKNNGYLGQNLKMSVSGPGEAFLQPDEFYINPTEGREIALYIEPPVGVNEAKYLITAKTEDKEDSVELTANLSGPVCMISPPALEKPQGVVLLPPPQEGTNETGKTVEQGNSEGTPTAGAVSGGDWALVIVAIGLLVLGAVLAALLLVSRHQYRTSGELFPEAGRTMGPAVPGAPVAEERASGANLAAQRREAMKEAILQTES